MSTTVSITSAARNLSGSLQTVSQKPEQDDQIFTIDELIKRRASELENLPLFGYPKQGLIDFEEHSARSVDRYVDAAVEKLQRLGLASVDSTLEKPPVVGILAQSGLHIIITILGLSRLGYTVFLMSTRLASPAIAQLLELADCSSILTTSNFHSVLSEVQKERQLTIKPLLSPEDYYGKQAPQFTRSCNPEQESQKIAVIIHSSGSTGLPKPIWLSHQNCIASAAANMNMRAMLTSPLFHSHGFYEIFRSIYSKKPLYLCNYTIPLTRQNLIDMIEHVKPEVWHCVPYLLKLLAETEDGIVALSKVKLVLFGGSSCPDDLGDRLVQRGVYLVANYGATETGRVMNSVRPLGDKAWNYLRPLPSAKKYLLMDEIAPGIHECVALPGLKSKSTTNSDDPPGSFRTRDLFAPHPTKPDMWRYISRLDDRFTLINGEKVLPIPLEGRIRQEECVKEAIVFGEGRSYPGVLIVKADKSNHLSNEQFIEEVWPAVQAANARAETFSHVPKELVVILSADTTYPRTDKGTFIRVPVYRQFSREIEAAYDAFENEQRGTLALEGEALETYLLRRLKERFSISLASSDADFFTSGIDSLHCIQMWNLIKRELDLGGRQSQLGQNILYETGNVKNLARHLNGLRTGREDGSKNELEQMQNLIVKYSSFEPHVTGTTAKPETDHVLLTGVTGGLGAHMLAQLTAQENILTVWTMVRAPTDAIASDRVSSSLEARGINLTSEQKAKVVSLACDFSRSDFGVAESKLLDLKSRLTLVIHSAWAVNFNISVQSFEDQHIKAVHNLIRLCLSVQTPSPAHFYYCSSVSAAGGSPRPGTVQEGPVSKPSYAQNTGYARSKYVAEHITLLAMRTTNITARVLRIGQLVGDSKVGEWNATEGIPLMIQTAVTLGALPALDEEMTWLPVDYAAAVILELAQVKFDQGPQQSRNRNSDADLVYHVLNPNRFHWTRDMLPSLASAGLEFEVLRTEEWMEKLRTSDRDPTKNPPIKLLDWFEGKYGHKARSAKTEVLEYQTEETKKDSPTLRGIPSVTEVPFVQMMIGRLKKHWNSVA